MLTFAVDPVEPVTTPLPRVPYDLGRVLGASVLARSAGLEDCVAVSRLEHFSGVNGFALAVHVAFAEHRPLVLSPDAVWLTILQGFSLHVRQHEAELRARLVDHQEKNTVALTVTSLADADWPAIADDFVIRLADEVNPGLIQAMTDKFSTTGETEHAAHCVAAMDSFSRYFDFEVVSICGIPSITLLGTAEDWRALRERFRVLAELGLQWWEKRLGPVLEHFVRAAEGDTDPSFWRCIYKPEKAYGGEVATGWLVRLFPYLEAEDGTFLRNEMKSLTGKWVHEPVRPSSFPKGLSKVTLRLRGVGVPTPCLRTLCAGFFGVTQGADGALLPHIGWALLEEETAQLWDELARAHRLPPPRPDRRFDGPGAVPALLLEFFDHFDGGPLYDGELVLTVAPARWTSVSERIENTLIVPLLVPEPSGTDANSVSILDRFAVRVGSLRDGSELLWLREGRDAQQKELVLVRPRGERPPYRIIANSLLEFFQRLASVPSFPPWETKGTWTPPPDER